MLVYIVIVNAHFVDNTFLRWMRNDKKLQKDLCLFRALPYASVCVVKYLESRLSDITRHPQPRLPDGRLKSRKYKKSAVGGTKSPATPVQKRITLFSIGSCHIDGKHKLLFFFRQRRPFFTAHGRFLNRGGCCRHAKHDIGGEGGDKEENSFSDWRHRQPPKGEADNSRHGFLCLYQPLTGVSINRLTPQLKPWFLPW